MDGKDKIYDRDEPGPFVFNDAVAQVFPDMIKRSVPGYADVITGTGLIAGDYIQPQSNAYDLGCSTGASTLSMLQHITIDDFHIVAVDSSPGMIERCRENTQDAGKVSYRCEDILDTDISNTSVAVLNYTLQFIPPEKRITLLEKIYKGMKSNGVLILSEKLSFDNDAEQSRQTALHESFKRTQGYSELAISRKRTALENVLIPESCATHLERLNNIGFHDVQLWFRCINFASILAWK